MTDFPKVRISVENDAWSRLYCSDPVLFDRLRESMTHMTPGARHMPLYKKGIWDGKLRLLSKDGAFHTGLAERLGGMAAEMGGEVSYDGLIGESPITMEFVVEYIESLKLPFPPRDYQVEGIYKALLRRRCLLVSPTASGKSLVAYVVARFLVDHGMRVLIVVPSKSLVKQMIGDFIDYRSGGNFAEGVVGGVDRSKLTTPATVSTWQSIYKEDSEFLSEWKAVIGDEVHGFKAKSLVDIMSKMTSCPVRVGMTATMNKEEVHRMTLEGLFGKPYVLTTARKLMDRGDIATLEIVPIILRYCERDRVAMTGMRYQHEMKFITQNPARWKFIVDMVDYLQGNTVILYQFVEKHGKPLHALFEKRLENTRRPLYFFHGGVDVDAREDFRRMMEGDNNAVAVASYGTFSQGVNVKAIHNVIFASPYKSYIKVVQSLGRGLRLAENKDNLMLYDLVDEICPPTGMKTNYAWKHWKSRFHTYEEENFAVSDEMEYHLDEVSFFIK